MNVLFFDQRTLCLVCGHLKPVCTCDRKRLTPCRCNPTFCAGGWQGCPDCHGRGWIDKKETKA
jgi:hypothetical protein